jgi:hypothetical protein
MINRKEHNASRKGLKGSNVYFKLCVLSGNLRVLCG